MAAKKKKVTKVKESVVGKVEFTVPVVPTPPRSVTLTCQNGTFTLKADAVDKDNYENVDRADTCPSTAGHNLLGVMLGGEGTYCSEKADEYTYTNKAHRAALLNTLVMMAVALVKSGVPLDPALAAEVAVQNG